jgi:hypothetical protein
MRHIFPVSAVFSAEDEFQIVDFRLDYNQANRRIINREYWPVDEANTRTGIAGPSSSLVFLFVR